MLRRPGMSTVIACALAIAGCAADRSCENHRALDAAVASGDEHERVRRQEIIDKEIEGRSALRRMGIKDPLPVPGKDCPRCNKLDEDARRGR